MEEEKIWKKSATVLAEFLPRGAFVYTVIFMTIVIAYVVEDPLVREALDEYFSPHSPTLIAGLNVGISVTVVYYLVVSLSVIFAKRYTEYHDSAVAVGTHSGVEKKLLTEERKNRVEYHEAGHLLGIGFFEAKPNKLMAKVHSYLGPTLGSVSYEFDDEFMCSKKSQLAVMKVALSGALAEEMVFGDCYVGTQTDNHNWERQAKNLMAAYLDDYHWFHIVSNEYEATVNSTTLVKLKEEMSRTVKEMLQNNEGLLHKTAEYLRENPESEGEELYNFVKQVVLV